MDTDSEPPSTMNLTDLEEMALNPPDRKAANLTPVPAQETLALPVTTYSAANSPCESHCLIDYNTSMEKRIGSLLEIGLYHDATFFAGVEKIPIKVHKLILSIASPVFATMFYGTLKSEDDVYIPDCKPVAFNSLLQFVYKNVDPTNPSMSLEECTDVLYVARKYNIRGLEDACHMSLCTRVSEETVFDILNACSFYDLSALMSLCWEFVEDHALKVLEFNMPEIEINLLAQIMENERLNIQEIELFHLLLKWAENECKTQELDPTPENKRKVSEFLLQHVRFPIMNPTEFADHVAQSGLLTEKETANIYTHISASFGRKPTVTGFSTRFRTPRFIRNGKPVTDLCSPGIPCVFEYIPPNQVSTNNRRRMASASRRRRH